MRPRGLLLITCRLALALYPAAWRDRYNRELEEVLEQHGATTTTVVDLVPGLAPTISPSY